MCKLIILARIKLDHLFTGLKASKVNATVFNKQTVPQYLTNKQSKSQQKSLNLARLPQTLLKIDKVCFVHLCVADFKNEINFSPQCESKTKF